MAIDYAAWSQQARERLAFLHEERDRIDQEIALLEGALPALNPLSAAIWSREDAGLTESIRQVLRGETNQLFSPPEIRDELVRRRFPLNQRNPMAVIHQILSRLVSRGEVQSTVIEGRTRYRNAQPKAPEHKVGDLVIVSAHKRKASQRKKGS